GSAPWPALDRVSQGRASCAQSVSALVLVAQPANQIDDMWGDTLIDNVVVQGPQLLPDASLNLPAQASFGLMGRVGGWPHHRILALRLFRDRFNRFEVCLAMLHNVVFSPFAHLPAHPLRAIPLIA